MRSEALKRKLEEREDRRRAEVVQFAVEAAIDRLRASTPSGSLATQVSAATMSAMWPAYMKQVRDERNVAGCWPSTEVEQVAVALDRMAESVTGLNAVWIGLAEQSLHYGIECIASELLRLPPKELANRAHDLMLSTHDAVDGLCLEYNSLGRNYEFQLVAWGVFRDSVEIADANHALR